MLWWMGIIGSFLLIFALVLVNIFMFPQKVPRQVRNSAADATDSPCRWKDGDPELYFLKTSLGVNYEGSHWFHMAETFMVQHSILRKTHRQSNSTNIYYLFDKSKCDLHFLFVIVNLLQLLLGNRWLRGKIEWCYEVHGVTWYRFDSY